MQIKCSNFIPLCLDTVVFFCIFRNVSDFYNRCLLSLKIL
jgi:hypothetical protein